MMAGEDVDQFVIFQYFTISYTRYYNENYYELMMKIMFEIMFSFVRVRVVDGFDPLLWPVQTR